MGDPQPTPLNFNLTSSGLGVTGKTNSPAELAAFIDTLKKLVPLLPELGADEAGQRNDPEVAGRAG